MIARILAAALAALAVVAGVHVTLAAAAGLEIAVLSVLAAAIARAVRRPTGLRIYFRSYA